MNGHQVRKLSPFHYIEIILITGTYNKINISIGRGFMAIVTSCRYRQYVDSSNRFGDTPRIIISKSLLYGSGLSTTQMEVLTFGNVAPCNCIFDLSVIYLDVVCGSSELIVERSNYVWISSESWV
ncbi:hypothetical protein CHS0354_027742 [Potamilus streckersoni]|uniref:Uncharacterized protein n=1 Tax=Potamilus streckersoni TaxID=2493646 RepID=A0AAE0S878_9BIVA|nr:hypothetical protein CHS0354_027742 [Potamilus streckersoni]